MNDKTVSAAPVDVLAVMGGAAAVLDTPTPCETAKLLREARAAVAELIPAAGGALHDLLAMVAAADRGEVWVTNAGTRARLENLAAALAAVGVQP